MDSILAWIMGLAISFFPNLDETPVEGVYYGYAEGEYLYIGSRFAGTITEIAVTEGLTVKAGDLLFSLDSEREQEALGIAHARLATARALYHDTTQGGRNEELQVIEARLRSAEANRNLKQTTLNRTKELRARNVVPQNRLDEDRESLNMAVAMVRQLKAELAVSRLPEREDLQAAARQDILAVESSVRTAEIGLSERFVLSPVDAAVERVYLRVGEQAKAAAPVVSLLPPDNMKVRFYIPEPDRFSLNVGDHVSVDCSGCSEPFSGLITFIATSAEFTPPVIYSLEERAKLVFLVEAKLKNGTLVPGQPVDVRVVP